ncbi:MAG: hypothetical protein WC812_03700 [Candidatus Pacearchaeota archaeon]|jgi:hypothetical protein
MINKKEIAAILITGIVLAFAVSLFNLKTLFLTSLISIFIILILNIFAKKLIGYFLDTDVEIDFWTIRRFGFQKHMHAKKPILIGLFLPIVIKAITVGIINWTASLTFEVKARVYRAAKRHGIYAFTEMSEAQIGVIAASGIIINLIFAIVGYFLGFEEFAKLSLGFAFFNMIPISNLDGNKIFFGSIVLWIFLATIVLLGLLAAILII